MNKKDLGKILKELRIASNLTQKDVAQALGRKQQVIGSWENGISQPDVLSLFELCDLYGTTVDRVFNFTNDYNRLTDLLINKSNKLSIESKEKLNKYINILELQDENNKNNLPFLKTGKEQNYIDTLELHIMTIFANEFLYVRICENTKSVLNNIAKNLSFYNGLRGENILLLILKDFMKDYINKQKIKLIEPIEIFINKVSVLDHDYIGYTEIRISLNTEFLRIFKDLNSTMGVIRPPLTEAIYHYLEKYNPKYDNKVQLNKFISLIDLQNNNRRIANVLGAERTIYKKLRNLILEKNINIDELSSITNVPVSVLITMANQTADIDSEINFELLDAISKALNVDITYFLEKDTPVDKYIPLITCSTSLFTDNIFDFKIYKIIYDNLKYIAYCNSVFNGIDYTDILELILIDFLTHIHSSDIIEISVISMYCSDKMPVLTQLRCNEFAKNVISSLIKNDYSKTLSHFETMIVDYIKFLLEK